MRERWQTAHDTRDDTECPTFVHCALQSAPALWTIQTYKECHLLADGNRVLGITAWTERALRCCKAVLAIPGSCCAVAMGASLADGQRDSRSPVPCSAFMSWCSPRLCVLAEADRQADSGESSSLAVQVWPRGLADGMVHRRVGRGGRCPTP